MRPPRLILLLLCFILLPMFLTILSLLSSQSESNSSPGQVRSRTSRLKALFSFHAPSSLFPPSAIISLTDDNSTFFLARPAAFGPLLPSNGLSAQLWIGSGFGDDSLQIGGIRTAAEGELGCSDVPGWEDENYHVKNDHGYRTGDDDLKARGSRAVLHAEIPVTRTEKGLGYESDANQSGSKGGKVKNKATTHADIQSLQDSAEIAGKVALLSRGGCGFLEKVEWAQRRGAVALIVGDDTRGGGLVTMYARGDTSNVTIPSVFTSYTTAHLLSSLIPPGQGVSGKSQYSLDSDKKSKKNRNSRTPPTQASSQTDSPVANMKSGQNGPKRGSISSGSGEYFINQKVAQGREPSRGERNDDVSSTVNQHKGSQGGNWWSRTFGRGDEEQDEIVENDESYLTVTTMSKPAVPTQNLWLNDGSQVGHEGLWVTLTPTNMSTSPFFDTLLVLVVSPLVTLTVVYALLLLRSRIRRRRWRAPKAIVDRLPVRTYHTISSNSSAQSTQSPDSSSPSSPLLSRARPSAPSEQALSPTASDSLRTNSNQNGRETAEKRKLRTSARRKRYTGRQVECVVCLEEYIDGQSRVMSLPCGHEFHAECITPWLTTRRRTCPICKGDVVRSLGRSPGSNSMDDEDETFDDMQSHIAEARNDSPTSGMPIAASTIMGSDLERGDQSREALLGGADDEPSESNWRNLASLSLSALSGDSTWHQPRHTRSDRRR